MKRDSVSQLSFILITCAVLLQTCSAIDYLTSNTFPSSCSFLDLQCDKIAAGAWKGVQKSSTNVNQIFTLQHDSKVGGGNLFSSRFWASAKNNVWIQQSPATNLVAGINEIVLNGWAKKVSTAQLQVQVRTVEGPEIKFTFSYKIKKDSTKQEIVFFFIVPQAYNNKKFIFEVSSTTSNTDEVIKVSDIYMRSSTTKCPSLLGDVKQLDSGKNWACIPSSVISNSLNCYQYKILTLIPLIYECSTCKSPLVGPVSMESGGKGCVHGLIPNTATYKKNSQNKGDSNGKFLVPASCTGANVKAVSSYLAVPSYSQDPSSFASGDRPCRSDYANIYLWNIIGSSYGFAECNLGTSQDYIDVTLDTMSEPFKGCIARANNNGYDSYCSKYAYNDNSKTFNCSQCSDPSSYQPVSVDFTGDKIYKRCMSTVNNKYYDLGCKFYTPYSSTFDCKQCMNVNHLPLAIYDDSDLYHKCYSATASDNYYDVNCAVYSPTLDCLQCANPNTHKLVKRTFPLNQQYDGCVLRSAEYFDEKCIKYNSNDECIVCADDQSGLNSDLYDVINVYKNSNYRKLCQLKSDNKYDAKCDYFSWPELVCQQCVTNFLGVPVSIGNEVFQQCIQITPNIENYDTNCALYTKDFPNPDFKCIQCSSASYNPIKVELSTNTFFYKCEYSEKYDANCVLYDSSKNCVRCSGDPSQVAVPVDYSDTLFMKCFTKDLRYTQNCIKYDQSFVCQQCGNGYKKLSVQYSSPSGLFEQCVIDTDKHYDPGCKTYNDQLDCVECTIGTQTPFPTFVEDGNYMRCSNIPTDFRKDQKCSHYTDQICDACHTDYVIATRVISRVPYQRCILTNNNQNYDQGCSIYSETWNCIDCTIKQEVPVRIQIGSSLYWKCLSKDNSEHRFDQHCDKYNKDFECKACDNKFERVLVNIESNPFSRCINANTEYYDQKCVEYDFETEDKFNCKLCKIKNIQSLPTAVDGPGKKVYFKCLSNGGGSDPSGGDSADNCKQEGTTKNGVKTCKSCKSTHMLAPGTNGNQVCVLKYITGCTGYNKGGECVECESGAPFNQKTKTCPPNAGSIVKNCQTVNNKNICKACMTNFILINDACIKKVDYCQTYANGLCSKCIPNYNLVRQECLKQPNNCLKVDSSNKCTKCSDLFYPSNGKCISKASLNAPVQEQVQCPIASQYRNENGVCVQGNVQYCLQYNSPYGACRACQSGYLVDEWGKCIASCPADTSTIKYVVQNNKCIRTDSKCLSTNADGSCSMCDTGFYAFNGICLEIPSMKGGAIIIESMDIFDEKGNLRDEVANN